MLKIYLTMPVIAFLLSGCLMIGKQEFDCKNREDLKETGIGGSTI